MINTHNLFEAPLLEEQMDMYIKYENIESVWRYLVNDNGINTVWLFSY